MKSLRSISIRFFFSLSFISENWKVYIFLKLRKSFCKRNHLEFVYLIRGFVWFWNQMQDGRHGKAWGIVHKDGDFFLPHLFSFYAPWSQSWSFLSCAGLRAAEAPKKISGVHKRCWKYIPNLSKTAPATTSAHVQAAWSVVGTCWSICLRFLLLRRRYSCCDLIVSLNSLIAL